MSNPPKLANKHEKTNQVPKKSIQKPWTLVLIFWNQSHPTSTTAKRKHLKFNSKSPWKVTFPSWRSILPRIIFQVKTVVCCPGLASTNLQVERVEGTWLLRVFSGDEILPSYVGNISLTIVKLTLKKAKTRKIIHGLWKGLTSFFFKNCDVFNGFFSCVW